MDFILILDIFGTLWISPTAGEPTILERIRDFTWDFEPILEYLKESVRYMYRSYGWQFVGLATLGMIWAGLHFDLTSALSALILSNLFRIIIVSFTTTIGLLLWVLFKWTASTTIANARESLRYQKKGWMDWAGGIGKQ